VSGLRQLLHAMIALGLTACSASGRGRQRSRASWAAAAEPRWRPPRHAARALHPATNPAEVATSAPCRGRAQAEALRAEAVRWQEAQEAQAFLEAQARRRPAPARKRGSYSQRGRVVIAEVLSVGDRELRSVCWVAAACTAPGSSPQPAPAACAALGTRLMHPPRPARTARADADAAALPRPAHGGCAVASSGQPRWALAELARSRLQGVIVRQAGKEVYSSTFRRVPGDGEVRDPPPGSLTSPSPGRASAPVSAGRRAMARRWRSCRRRARPTARARRRWPRRRRACRRSWRPRPWSATPRAPPPRGPCAPRSPRPPRARARPACCFRQRAREQRAWGLPVGCCLCQRGRTRGDRGVGARPGGGRSGGAGGAGRARHGGRGRAAGGAGGGAGRGAGGADGRDGAAAPPEGRRRGALAPAGGLGARAAGRIAAGRTARPDARVASAGHAIACLWADPRAGSNTLPRSCVMNGRWGRQQRSIALPDELAAARSGP